MAYSLLVTGGAGFIGSNFIKMLLQRTDIAAIVNLDALTYAGNLATLAECQADPRYHFVRGSINNRELVRHLLRTYSINGVINFAAESHVDRSIMGADAFLQTNVQGTLTLMDCAREAGVERYLQVSTDEVYGTLGDSDPAFEEDFPLLPNSPYSASKAAADMFVRSYVHTHDFPAVITRCSNNYGPYQFPEKLIPLMILNAMSGKPLPVYGDGMNIRDWIHVQDHCTGVWAAFERGKDGEIYNFGGREEHPNIAIVREIIDILGADEQLITYVKDRPGHDRRYAVNCSKSERELGWKQIHTFKQGLADTIDWYKHNEDWWKPIIDGSYKEYYRLQYAV